MANTGIQNNGPLSADRACGNGDKGTQGEEGKWPSVCSIPLNNLSSFLLPSEEEDGNRNKTPEFYSFQHQLNSLKIKTAGPCSSVLTGSGPQTLHTNTRWEAAKKQQSQALLSGAQQKDEKQQAQAETQGISLKH